MAGDRIHAMGFRVFLGEAAEEAEPWSACSWVLDFQGRRQRHGFGSVELFGRSSGEGGTWDILVTIFGSWEKGTGDMACSSVSFWGKTQGRRTWSRRIGFSKSCREGHGMFLLEFANKREGEAERLVMSSLCSVFFEIVQGRTYERSTLILEIRERERRWRVDGGGESRGKR
jgi:hypothetical protein